MDRIEKLIRGGKPVAAPLSERAEADLARILATTPDARTAGGAPRSSRHRRTAWTWAAAAALVIALSITGVNLISPSRAVAATPPMLRVTHVEAPADRTLQTLKARALAQPDHSNQTQIITQWWGLASEVDASGTITSSVVDPRRRVTTVGAQGITQYTDYAAEPYDTQGEPTQDPTAPSPGTVIETVKVDPDQRVFAKAPPTESAKFGRYLRDALDPYSSSPAVNAFSDIRSLLTERTLSPTQNAALLGYLATLPDISLVGSTTDRLGRTVMVFASPTEKDNQTLLMLSDDTGGVLATEVIYRGSQRTDIPSPAVIEYVAWETP